MNQLIKDYAKHADDYADTYCDSVERFAKYDMIRDAKFAELVIYNATECVRDVLRDEKSELTYAGCNAVQQRIKQFFGVTANDRSNKTMDR